MKTASHVIEKTKEILLDILFPEICAGCEHVLPRESKTRGICTACLEALEVKTALTCPTCGARLAEGKKTCHSGTTYRLAAATNYENRLMQRFVRELKYGRRTAYGRPIAAAIALHLGHLNLNFSSYAILPVPLHRARERERGFNQSRVIGEFLSEEIGLPLLPADVFLRVRNTPPQAELNRDARLTNIKGSFAVHAPEKIPPQIILLDDVSTSGATIREIVATLRSAGVRKVTAVVAAKA